MFGTFIICNRCIFFSFVTIRQMKPFRKNCFSHHHHRYYDNLCSSVQYSLQNKRSYTMTTKAHLNMETVVQFFDLFLGKRFFSRKSSLYKMNGTLNETRLIIVKVYEFDNPIITKIDSKTDSCFKDCHNNWFDIFK